MTAKTKAQQDELSGPFTRKTRLVMEHIDAIAAMEGENPFAKQQALRRIEKYACAVREGMYERATVELE